jgi:hypothetical protein
MGTWLGNHNALCLYEISPVSINIHCAVNVTLIAATSTYWPMLKKVLTDQNKVR